PADAARARDPVDGVQVAQSPGGFLEVRLERIRRVLMLRVALLLLELLRLEEGDRVERRVELPHEVPEACAATREKAGFHQRRAHRDVLGRYLQAVLDGAHAVADLEARVPECADQVLDALALL